MKPTTAAIKERPIPFTGPNVCASRDGLKTQTRRTRGLDEVNADPGRWRLWGREINGHWALTDHPTQGEKGTVVNLSCPYGTAGDRLWVREWYIPDPSRDDDAWNTWRMTAHEWDGCGAKVADVPPALRKPANVLYKADPRWAKYPTWKWHSPMFMPRWASRLLLELTEVRLQRLKDISAEDAIAEGIAPLFDKATAQSRPEFDLDPMPWTNYLWHGHIGKTITAKQADAWPFQFSAYDDPRESYFSMWESINGPRGFGCDLNPWLWALTYKKVTS